MTDHAVLLEIRGLSVHFSVRGRGVGLLSTRREIVHAVDDLSLSIERGASVAIVGETGSGKSTLARTILGLVPATSGTVLFDGQEIAKAGARELKSLRRRIAMVAQDPFDSLNPRQKVHDILALPLQVHDVQGDREEIVRRVLEDVGLRPGDYLDRYPHEMSGGQRQRIAIARALALRPELLIADEPVTALDMSVRAQVLNLLQDLKEKYGLTYLVIAHDLSMVRYLARRVVVMYLGSIVEDAASEQLFATPSHPYTRALVAAAPSLVERPSLAWRLNEAEPPSPIDIPSGCRFHPRCPFAVDKCREEVPRLRSIANARVACHRAEELGGTGGLADSEAPARVSAMSP